MPVASYVLITLLRSYDEQVQIKEEVIQISFLVRPIEKLLHSAAKYTLCYTW